MTRRFQVFQLEAPTSLGRASILMNEDWPVFLEKEELAAEGPAEAEGGKAAPGPAEAEPPVAGDGGLEEGIVTVGT